MQFVPATCRKICFLPDELIRAKQNVLWKNNADNPQKEGIMPRIKFSSNIIKERRIRLGFEPCEVAKLVGVKMDTYR
jgi:hypothetical protein